MRLWDASTGAETACLHGNIDTINDVAFSCVSSHLVAAGSDNALQVFDVGTGRSRHILRNHTARVSRVLAGQRMAKGLRCLVTGLARILVTGWTTVWP